MKLTISDNLSRWASVTLDGELFVCASSADEEAGIVVRDGIEHSGKVRIRLLDGAPQWALDEYTRRMRAEKEGGVDLFAKPDTERERFASIHLTAPRANYAQNRRLST